MRKPASVCFGVGFQRPGAAVDQRHLEIVGESLWAPSASAAAAAITARMDNDIHFLRAKSAHALKHLARACASRRLDRLDAG
jgi:hypothetical protein